MVSFSKEREIERERKRKREDEHGFKKDFWPQAAGTVVKLHYVYYAHL